MNIIIFGLGKSGTTAIYYKIKNSLKNKEEYAFHFEPLTIDFEKSKNICAKILFDPFKYSHDNINLKNFNKKIFIIRDPRDTLVSYLLYATGYHVLHRMNPAKQKAVLDLIKNKEANPDKISCFELYRQTDIQYYYLNIQTNYLKIYKFLEQNNDFLVIKYEDLINRKINKIEEYLGIQFIKNDNIDISHKRVIRSKKSGNWKDWFTSEDINKLQDKLNPILKTFNYSTNWKTNDNKTIEPETASIYVNKLLQEKTH